jgi:hypothetical protein
MSLRSRSCTQQLYHHTQNKSYDTLPHASPSATADYECLAHTSSLRFPIEVSASQKDHHTQNRLRHEPACTQPSRFANIWSVFALHLEDTMMTGLGEATNLKIHGSEGVKWMFSGSMGRLKLLMTQEGQQKRLPMSHTHKEDTKTPWHGYLLDVDGNQSAQ